MFERDNGLPIGDILLVGWMPSVLKKWWYRRRGYKVAGTASFGIGSVIVGNDVDIGPECRIGILVVIKGRKIKIGPRVRVGHLSVIDTYKLDVGEGTRIGNQVVVGGLATPQSSLTIGRNCILMEWSFINTTMPVAIGDEVGIGGHCLFFTHGLWPNGFEGFPVNFGPIVIEDQAWLAWRVTVLPGVTIGAKSIVSSDACVTKNVPTLVLSAGTPAKAIRENGTYISPVSFESNKTRLTRLFESFCIWVEFHGGHVQSREPGRIGLRFGRNHAKSGRIVAPDLGGEGDAAYAELSPEDVLVSLSPLSDERRMQIEKTGCAWLDIANKERSKTRNPVGDELEEFLRREGLRFLKYGRWKDVAR